MDKILFRHDAPRRYQQQFLDDIYSSVSEGGHLLAHAPTGSGKTDSALSASLTYALENDLTVFFLTPKISQHKIAVEVTKGIAEKYNLNIRATDFIGRRYACIDPSLADLDHDGFYLSCEKKRKKESCEFFWNGKGYSKLDQARANSLFESMLSGYGHAKTHSELIKLGELHSACPYEWMVRAASLSNVIIADYFQFMIPKIRELFFLKTKKKIQKSIVIIDEAHNLAKRIREQMSCTVNSFTLARAEKEIGFIGAKKLDLFKEFNQWAGKFLKDQSEILASKEMFDDFLSQYYVDGVSKTELADYFESIGSEIIERTNKKSACMSLSKFLRSWDTEEKGSFRILRRRGKAYLLSKRFLDPSSVTCELNSCHSAILMSGTLLPLEMHRDILGLDISRTNMRSYRSPFDDNNSMNIIANSTTTRYSKRDFKNYSKIADDIDKIILSSPKGVALFFPSYNVMNSVVPLLKHRNLLVQKENMLPLDVGNLLREFSNGGILCAVQGGSLAEGVDYCNGEIKTAVVVGVALEEPSLETKSLIDYYQEKFSKGWEYGYMYPAVIKALQAAGRGIRKESDRSAVVFMDERFNWKNYRTILNGDGRKFVVTDEPDKYVKFFWSGVK